MKRVMAIGRLIVVMGGKHACDLLLEMHNELKQSFPLDGIPRRFLKKGVGGGTGGLESQPTPGMYG